MSEATKLATAAGSKDPAAGLRAVAALRHLLERLEALQVGNARTQGWSWQAIAEELGVSKQSESAAEAWRSIIDWPRPVASPLRRSGRNANSNV